MKTFHKIFAAAIVMVIAVFAVTNIMMIKLGDAGNGRPYRVEMERLALEIEENGLGNVDISGCEYVVYVEKISGYSFDTDSDYSIKEINGELYRFDYLSENHTGKKKSCLQ